MQNLHEIRNKQFDNFLNLFHRNSWLVFSGGMPRASYGDKFTVTVMKGDDKHSVFDLTSKIIDFEIVGENPGGAPGSLVILAEEEMVVIDMTDDSWPAHTLPYLNSIHASAVTCLSYVEDISNDEVWTAIQDIKAREFDGSDRVWPVNGGKVEEDKKKSREVLMTGHEDGSVKMWSCDGIDLSPLAVIKTSKYFVGDELDEPNGKR